MTINPTNNNNGDEQDHWIHIAELTAKIIAAYVGNSNIRVEEEKLPALITNIRDALTPKPKQSRRKRPSETLAAELAAFNDSPPKVQKATQPPKVDPKKSITRQYIFCLECGTACKILSIHVRRMHNFSIPEYLYRWDLPSDYPITSKVFQEEEAARRGAVDAITDTRELAQRAKEIQRRLDQLEEQQHYKGGRTENDDTRHVGPGGTYDGNTADDKR